VGGSIPAEPGPSFPRTTSVNAGDSAPTPWTRARSTTCPPSSPSAPVRPYDTAGLVAPRTATGQAVPHRTVAPAARRCTVRAATTGASTHARVARPPHRAVPSARRAWDHRRPGTVARPRPPRIPTSVPSAQWLPAAANARHRARARPMPRPRPPARARQRLRARRERVLRLHRRPLSRGHRCPTAPPLPRPAAPPARQAEPLAPPRGAGRSRARSDA
jgi:hypothetical protein